MKIFGHEVEIRYTDLSGANIAGNSQYLRSVIEIGNNGQSRSQMEDTLIHELLHQISYVLKLDMKEELVHRLAAGLHTVIKDNPVRFHIVHTYAFPILPSSASPHLDSYHIIRFVI